MQQNGRKKCVSHSLESLSPSLLTQHRVCGCMWRRQRTDRGGNHRPHHLIIPINTQIDVDSMHHTPPSYLVDRIVYVSLSNIMYLRINNDMYRVYETSQNATTLSHRTHARDYKKIEIEEKKYDMKKRTSKF